MRYFIQVQNPSGVPVLLLLLFVSIVGLIFGFLLRGILSFLFQDASSILLQFVDWFLFAGMIGLIVSLIGVISGAMYFLYRLRRMMKHQEYSDYEYSAEFRRIDDETGS